MRLCAAIDLAAHGRQSLLGQCFPCAGEAPVRPRHDVRPVNGRGLELSLTVAHLWIRPQEAQAITESFAHLWHLRLVSAGLSGRAF